MTAEVTHLKWKKKNSIVRFVQVKFEIPVGHGSGDVR